MFHRIRLSLLPSRTSVPPLFAARMVSTAVLLSLLLSLVLPVTVYADDAAPPTSVPAAETAAVDEGSTGAVTAAEPAAVESAPVDSATTTAETAAVDEVSTEAATAAEPAAAETAPVDSAASTEAAVIADPVAETAPAEEILATVPEGTELVVLDENGESVPLATSEAAEIIAAGDPLWCPSGVAPNPTVGGCSGSFGSIGALVVGFLPTGNGTIWVKWDSTQAGATIDGTLGPWSTIENYSLTILGGWNGTNGSTGLYTAQPFSVFSGAITDLLWIKNWVGAITLKNLTFNAFTYNSGTSFDTLLVQTQGNIILDKVQVLNANNLGAGVSYGATLDNTSGSGSVTVTNGVFTNNEGRGLSIFSKGAVTLKNVDADYNHDTGVWIVNDTATTAKPVTVTNAEFKGNNFRGLDLRSKGAVTLTNLVATYNATGDGVYVINTSGVAPVTINGVNNFSNNGWDGLEVASKGPIKVSNTTANYNVSDGVYLNTYAQPVTILGFLTAMYNGWDGLGIDTMGAVTAANLTLSYNTGASGAYINNTWGAVPPYTPHPVTITGTNFFNDNNLNGLVVYCDGAITLSSITAIHNGITNNSTGVYLKNNYLATAPQNVTINGTNVFNYNSKHGLEVYSFGAITLSNVTASYNWYDAATGAGVYLDNKTGATLAKPVLLSGVNSFFWNNAQGLYILSLGTVTLNKINATSNGAAGVFVNNMASPTLSGVTGLGYLTALNNSGSGLEVYSFGAVKFSTLTIKNNSGGYGAFIGNLTPTQTPKPVTITGTNLFGYNKWEGLAVISDGAVTLSNITAVYNGHPNNRSGVLIQNTGNPNFPQNVTISGYNVFSNNSKHGLEVHSYGAITLSNVTAEYNFYDAFDGAGVYLDNKTGANLARPVTLSGVNTFNYNDDQGLYIVSLGAVTLSKITAKFNSVDGADGVYVNNMNAHFQSKISVLGYGLFENNSQDGVDLNSNGAISLANVSANYNSGYGAQLWTRGLTAPQAVTLTGNNNFISNGFAGVGSGLLVNADGNILVSNINASYNQFRGADLDNWNNWNDHTPEPNFATYGSVTLTGFGNFIGNLNNDGLFIYTHGSATVNHATADNNGWDGVEIFGDHNVTLVCSSAYWNFWDGLDVTIPGLLTIKGFYTFPHWEWLSAGSIIRTGCP